MVLSHSVREAAARVAPGGYLGVGKNFAGPPGRSGFKKTFRKEEIGELQE